MSRSRVTLSSAEFTIEYVNIKALPTVTLFIIYHSMKDVGTDNIRPLENDSHTADRQASALIQTHRISHNSRIGDVDEAVGWALSVAGTACASRVHDV